MGSEYYETLEINRNATDADIKKAYVFVSGSCFTDVNN